MAAKDRRRKFITNFERNQSKGKGEQCCRTLIELKKAKGHLESGAIQMGNLYTMNRFASHSPAAVL